MLRGPHCVASGGEASLGYQGTCLVAYLEGSAMVNVPAGGAVGVWVQTFLPDHHRELSMVFPPQPEQVCPKASASAVFVSYVAEFD